MGEDGHGTAPVAALALASKLSAPSIGPAVFAGPDGVPAARTPASESRYLGEQGIYLAASGTLTQFNAIIAALLTTALSLRAPLIVKVLILLALGAHAVAGLLLCWAARPVANADATPRVRADDMLAHSFTAYRRGWRATMLALLLSVAALAALAWQTLGPEFLAALH
jgi:hypothetical protein